MLSIFLSASSNLACHSHLELCQLNHIETLSVATRFRWVAKTIAIRCLSKAHTHTRTHSLWDCARQARWECSSLTAPRLLCYNTYFFQYNYIYIWHHNRILSSPRERCNKMEASWLPNGHLHKLLVHPNRLSNELTPVRWVTLEYKYRGVLLKRQTFVQNFSEQNYSDPSEAPGALRCLCSIAWLFF